MSREKSTSGGRRGYSLIEMIMVIVILAILAAGIAGFIMTAMQAWVFISGRESTVTQSRVAMDRMVTELKRIRNPNSIQLAATSECDFLDLDANEVDFKQSGTSLMRNSDILATGLASSDGLHFFYLNASGEVTADKASMCSIRVRLSLASGTQLTTLESSARIRNL